MQSNSELSELTRPKSKPLLSRSLDREELLAAGVCVACRTFPVIHGEPHCPDCARRLAAADWHAFAGFRAELNRR